MFRPNPLEDFGSDLRREDSPEAVELVDNLIGRNLDLGFLQLGSRINLNSSLTSSLGQDSSQ